MLDHPTTLRIFFEAMMDDPFEGRGNRRYGVADIRSVFFEEVNTANRKGSLARWT
jgi:hypothetical protein